MKIPYKVILYGDKAYNSIKPMDVDYLRVIDSFDYCCSRMKDAWDYEYISFGEAEGNYNKWNSICMYAYNRGYIESIPIAFCPFCGQKIETYELSRYAPRIKNTITTTVECNEYIEEIVDK
jgi:hypothetical protein